VSPDGTIRAILDWEMVHLGDPLEDLAWSLNRSWSFGDRGYAGGLVPRAEAIAAWERASGLVADPRALHWWELLACVKGQAIWLSAARTFESGGQRDLMLAFAAWLLMNSQDRAILELMGHLA
jgi:aminoglycoside phosphotransferase (APT) family kinase protein